MVGGWRPIPPPFPPGWKEHLHRHATQPIQRFAYTKGKNSNHSAFIIDEIALLYSNNLDGFCLMSSDSEWLPKTGCYRSDLAGEYRR